ncbi:MAG: ABC transporter permease [Magnetospirillum sp.]|jgi:putative spermidine/putrescine transport system permease protein|nr:ABC transporter permease [Magnetospirillum sp.]
MAAAGWLALPAAAWATICFLLPLAILFATSFQSGDGAPFGVFARIFGDSYYRDVIANTVVYASVVTFACLVIGYPFALALVRLPGWLQAIGMIAILLPLTASAIVKTFGWTILLRTTGLVNNLLMAIGAIEAPIRILFTLPGLYLGTINMLLPFMILPIFAVMRRIDPTLLDAAATLRSGPVDRFLRVTLPLSLPGAFAGFSIVFSLASSAYVIPTLLIGERHKVLSKVIAHNFLVANDPALGAGLAVVLLVFCTSMIALAARFGRARTES